MKSVSILIAVFLLALSVGVALAQQQQQQGSMANHDQQGSGQTGQGLLSKAESLKGSDVVDKQARKLGKVDSVSLDLMTGRISYVVVDPEKGDKLIPVPYNNFGVLRNKQLVLDVDKNKLDAAPSFAKSAEPNWANPQWAQQVANFWGTAPSGIMTAGQATSGTTDQTMGSSQPMGATQQPMGTGGQPGTTDQPMGSSQPPGGGSP